MLIFVAINRYVPAMVGSIMAWYFLIFFSIVSAARDGLVTGDSSGQHLCQVQRSRRFTVSEVGVPQVERTRQRFLHVEGQKDRDQWVLRQQVVIL